MGVKIKKGERRDLNILRSFTQACPARVSCTGVEGSSRAVSASNSVGALLKEGRKEGGMEGSQAGGPLSVLSGRSLGTDFRLARLLHGHWQY